MLKLPFGRIWEKETNLYYGTHHVLYSHRLLQQGYEQHNEYNIALGKFWQDTHLSSSTYTGHVTCPIIGLSTMIYIQD